MGENIDEESNKKSNYILLILFILVMGGLSLIPLALDFFLVI